MEGLRARAEEVSTGATGDVQAKLLRQIETLQTQYAIASQNWQGIESTLLSRVRDLEKEKADIAKRESDVRRKAREAVCSGFDVIQHSRWLTCEVEHQIQALARRARGRCGKIGRY